jgi:HEAT repeat protein
LIHALGDDFYGARLMAVEALLDLPDTAAVVALLEDSLASPNALLGHVACRLLGRCGTDRALQLLFEQTASPDPERRAAAAEALVRADPEDLCGFQERVFERETDPDVLLKLESARYDIQHGRP